LQVILADQEIFFTFFVTPDTAAHQISLHSIARAENQQPPIKKRPTPTDATANFSLRFTRASESKVETTDWVLSRQALQPIATRLSLVGEAIGFSVLGILVRV
jgi:hypothetical protein